MHNTQLVNLLKVVSKKELRKFMEYLKSDYHNPNKDVSRLFLYIKKYAPQYDSPKLKRDIVCQYLFASKAIPFQNKTNKLAHQLKKVLQTFIIQSDLEQDSLLKEQIWIKALRKRHHPAYAKKSEHLLSLIRKEQARTNNTASYLALFQINDALLSNINTQKINSGLPTLEAANQHLDTFYFLHKLKLILEYKTAKSIISVNFNMAQYEEILALISNYQELKENKTIQLLLLAIQMIDSADDSDFFILKNALFSSIDQISKQDAQDILVALNNYYNKNIRKHTDFWAMEGFYLYAFADEHNLLLENNRIRDIEYTNAAVVGGHSKKTIWTLGFIEKYKPYLAPEIRESTYLSVKAYFYFQQQEFDNTLEEIRIIEQLEVLNPITVIRTRTLKLRAFFELWEQDQYPTGQKQSFLKHLIASFKRYMTQHKKLSSLKKQSYILFAQLMEHLTKISTSSSKLLEQLSMLQKDLLDNTSIAFRDWLQVKLKIRIAQLQKSSLKRG